MYRIPIVGNFFRCAMMTRVAIGYQLYLLILLNLASASIESIGILLFIPFLTQLGGSTAVAPDRITRAFYAFFAHWDMSVTVGHILVMLVIAFILKGLSLFCLHAARPMLIHRTEHRLRQRLIAQYADTDYQYALGKTTGFLSNLAITEVTRACEAIREFCRMWSSLITAGTLLIVVFFLHRSASLVVVAAGGLLFVLMRQLSALTARESRHLILSNTRLHAFLNQSLFSFKYLKATACFGSLQSQVSTTSDDIRKARNHQALLNALQFAAQEPFLVMFLAAFFYYTVVMANNSVASAMVAVLFFYRCMGEMGQIYNSWQSSAARIGSLDLVWTTIQEFGHHREANHDGMPGVLQGCIELRDVSYTYNSNPVLHEVNIRIPKNAAVAFVGRSGAGKTTLIDIICGLLTPVKGAVYIDHPALCELDLSRYRQSLGYVGQETVLFDDTIADNILINDSACRSNLCDRTRSHCRAKEPSQSCGVSQRRHSAACASCNRSQMEPCDGPGRVHLRTP